MRSRKSLVAAGAAAMVLMLVLASAEAQHGMPPAGPGGPPPHMLAQMCATAFEKNVGEGRGFGMAFVADQRGYPGPLHVIELKDRLKLTPEQEARAQALLAAMFAESRPKSDRLLEAERKLGRLFGEGTVDEPSIRAAVAGVEHARADVRLVHLMFHLKTRDLLTEEQRRVYHEARWGAHRPMGPHGGGPGADPGMHRGAMNPTQVSADEARAIAQKYVDEQLTGYTIENVVPSSGMPRTTYTVELKGPKGESKTLHVSPFGHVMPLPVPPRQG